MKKGLVNEWVKAEINKDSPNKEEKEEVEEIKLGFIATYEEKKPITYNWFSDVCIDTEVNEELFKSEKVIVSTRLEIPMKSIKLEAYTRERYEYMNWLQKKSDEYMVKPWVKFSIVLETSIYISLKDFASAISVTVNEENSMVEVLITENTEMITYSKQDLIDNIIKTQKLCERAFGLINLVQADIELSMHMDNWN